MGAAGLGDILLGFAHIRANPIKNAPLQVPARSAAFRTRELQTTNRRVCLCPAEQAAHRGNGNIAICSAVDRSGHYGEGSAGLSLGNGKCNSASNPANLPRLELREKSRSTRVRPSSEVCFQRSGS